LHAKGKYNTDKQDCCLQIINATLICQTGTSGHESCRSPCSVTMYCQSLTWLFFWVFIITMTQWSL